MRAEAETCQKRCIDQQAAEKPVVLEELTAATRPKFFAVPERLNPYGADITDAVDFYIERCKPPRGIIKISELVAEFRKVKSAAGMSTRYAETSANSFFAPFRDKISILQLQY